MCDSLSGELATVTFSIWNQLHYITYGASCTTDGINYLERGICCGNDPKRTACGLVPLLTVMSAMCIMVERRTELRWFVL